MASLSSLPALNAGTLVAGIIIAFPVCGLGLYVQHGFSL